MGRVVLVASIGAVLELAMCVGMHAATVLSTESSAAARPVAPSASLAPIQDAPRADALSSSSSSAQSNALPPPHTPARTDWDRLVAVDGAACRQKLGELGMKFQSLPDRPAPDAFGCGIPHGVVVQQGPTGIVYSPPLQIDCSLALELPGIERAIQEQGLAHLASPIRSVTTFGTFSCRKVRGGFTGKLSEHAFGNAIDFGGFVPRKGHVVNVARDYKPGADTPDEPGLFLRGVFRAFREDSGLTYVIGPETRADHHDHIHVDRAEPWWQALPSGA
jgi:hypothetical protein